MTREAQMTINDSVANDHQLTAELAKERRKDRKGSKNELKEYK
jgi:hypothetical protein